MQNEFPGNAEIAYEDLRSESTPGLQIFLNYGMLEWLKESVARPVSPAAANASRRRKLEQHADYRRNDLIILMTNMMEAADYENQSEN